MRTVDHNETEIKIASLSLGRTVKKFAPQVRIAIVPGEAARRMGCKFCAGNYSNCLKTSLTWVGRFK
jgi:hypothetical protein